MPRCLNDGLKGFNAKIGCRLTIVKFSTDDKCNDVEISVIHFVTIKIT